MRNPSQSVRSSKWLAAFTIAAAAAGAIGIAAVPAAAAVTAPLGSTTTLSVAMTADGSGLDLTATVGQSGSNNGVGVNPTGTVTFSDSAGDSLGTITVAHCLLKVCTLHRTVPTSQLANLVSSVTASYSGNTLLKPSSVSSALLYQRCTATAGCYGVLTNTSTALAVSLPTSDTVLVTLGGAQLPCSAGAGSVVNIASSGTGKALTMQLQHTGAAAATYAALDVNTRAANAHTNYRCDVSSASYQGFSSPFGSYTKTATDFAQYGATPVLASGSYAGLHAGLIPDCTYWFAHSASYAPVCNKVPASTPPAGNDVVFLSLNSASGVSHIAG